MLLQQFFGQYCQRRTFPGSFAAQDGNARPDQPIFGKRQSPFAVDLEPSLSLYADDTHRLCFPFSVWEATGVIAPSRSLLYIFLHCIPCSHSSFDAAIFFGGWA